MPDGICELQAHGLSNRTLSVLEEHGYVFIDDLVELDEGQILGWRNCGEAMVDEVRHALSSLITHRERMSRITSIVARDRARICAAKLQTERKALCKEAAGLLICLADENERLQEGTIMDPDDFVKVG